VNAVEPSPFVLFGKIASRGTVLNLRG
jgi:hypothetical protein